MPWAFCVIHWVHLKPRMVERRKSAATKVKLHGHPILRPKTRSYCQGASMSQNVRRISTDSRVGGFTLIDIKASARWRLVHQRSRFTLVVMVFSAEGNHFTRMDSFWRKGCLRRARAPVKKCGGLDSTCAPAASIQQGGFNLFERMLEWVWV